MVSQSWMGQNLILMAQHSDNIGPMSKDNDTQLLLSWSIVSCFAHVTMSSWIHSKYHVHGLLFYMPWDKNFQFCKF